MPKKDGVMLSKDRDGWLKKLSAAKIKLLSQAFLLSHCHGHLSQIPWHKFHSHDDEPIVTGRHEFYISAVLSHPLINTLSSLASVTKSTFDRDPTHYSSHSLHYLFMMKYMGCPS